MNKFFYNETIDNSHIIFLMLPHRSSLPPICYDPRPLRLARWRANRHLDVVPSLVDSGRLLLSDLWGQGALLLLEVQLMHDLVGAVGVL